MILTLCTLHLAWCTYILLIPNNSHVVSVWGSRVHIIHIHRQKITSTQAKFNRKEIYNLQKITSQYKFQINSIRYVTFDALKKIVTLWNKFDVIMKLKLIFWFFRFELKTLQFDTLLCSIRQCVMKICPIFDNYVFGNDDRYQIILTFKKERKLHSEQYVSCQHRVFYIGTKRSDKLLFVYILL
jgi:hypothetical protein